MKKRILSVIMAWTVFLSCLFAAPAAARAAGWLDCVQEITLGSAVSGSIKSGDYYAGSTYWHVYHFSMPGNGLLNLYLESETRYYNYMFLEIYAVSDPEYPVWEDNIDCGYSSARDIYSDWKQIALNQGEYYFALRKSDRINTPYYLTLSYQEPKINIASVTLNQSSLKLQPGEQRAISASIQPQNATDQTLIWRSSNPSVAAVQNGVVTAVSTGYASVTASSADGETSAVCQVTVTQPAAVVEVQEARSSIKKLTAGKKKVKVYFSPIKISGIRYQVSYITGSGKWRTKSCKGTTLTIKKLASKKKYSFRVRGYKKVNGATRYSRWSPVKTVKIK